MTYRGIIVDDEEAARSRLENMLQELNSPCKIIDKAEDGFEAIKMINGLKPDVVFLDIGLPGINGIELLRHCIHDPYVIFTTAYDKYAIEAFEAKTISYLVKPFSLEKLSCALRKLVTMTSVPLNLSVGAQISNGIQPTLQLVPVKDGDSIDLLRPQSIAWISAEDKYSILATKDKLHISSYTISELEERLNPVWFLRVHRCFIVNILHVIRLKKINNRRWKVVTDIPSNDDIMVSENYHDQLKTRLQIE